MGERLVRTQHSVLAEAKALTARALVLPLTGECIQHQADVPLVGSGRFAQTFQGVVDCLDGLWYLLIQVPFRGLVWHLLKINPPET